MLALRTQFKQDLKCTPAEITFGTTLRLLGDMINPSINEEEIHPQDYVEKLRSYLNQFKYSPPRLPANNPNIVDKDLDTCSHVYVRVDAVRQPLTKPYIGPFKVIKRSHKFFTLEIKGKHDTVAVDRLKVAVLPTPTQRSLDPNTDPEIVSPSGIYPCNPVTLRPLVYLPQQPCLTETVVPDVNLQSRRTVTAPVKQTIASHNKSVHFSAPSARNTTQNKRPQTQTQNPPVSRTQTRTRGALTNVNPKPRTSTTLLRPETTTRSGRTSKQPSRYQP